MSNQMNLSNGIHVTLPYVEGTIFGGPFKSFAPHTRRLSGIKMAVEINHPHDMAVDTVDFSVPEPAAMVKGLCFALSELYNGKDIYVGCWGGVGRTGLFMGCMVKAMQDYEVQTAAVGVEVPYPDPVKVVRRDYSSHAIETEEQRAYVRGFDTAEVIEWYKLLVAPHHYVAPVPVAAQDDFITRLLKLFKII